MTIADLLEALENSSDVFEAEFIPPSEVITPHGIAKLYTAPFILSNGDLIVVYALQPSDLVRYTFSITLSSGRIAWLKVIRRTYTYPSPGEEYAYWGNGEYQLFKKLVSEDEQTYTLRTLPPEYLGTVMEVREEVVFTI